ncbi:response regulator [Melissococcus plutonius]|uniref:Two-component response regulator n=1 Tax=Melissococcus plutonius (strain ATCC 35311 / DSM 29964 / CIP 104052 / LMG 20360 / NCIMB 702443) TaxID=940190 RepID=F3Y7U1_MELPT|nr:response regulator transcription factor [Melissococcus plutonius]AIM24354.1 two-component response regulator [Melissococcus plutonius S1]KMT25726.1 two-component response regulator [Melissococcus plutonius]KMT27071.1 two-component response regulator [Melissococcus plutonius]KMT28447.1 two-component response regulator [Melissococcus plutonius]KMT29909.1 two-component response regulator [Melissococcus plutonius]
MVRIYLAEDQELLNTALKMILNLEEDFEVIGSATDGKTAFVDIIRLKPDIVLLDIETPEMTGLEIARQIQLMNLDIKIVILTTFAQESYFKQAIQSQVNGYMLKDSPSDELIRSLYSILAGDTIFSHELVSQSFVTCKNPLTDREIEILNLLKKGANTKQIAENLFLSNGTVRNYISAILNKTGTKSRIEAINLANEQGWI